MTPEGKLRQRIVLRAFEAGWDLDGMRARASEVVGRTLVEEFGLTTCTLEELTRILADIPRAQGTGHGARGRPKTDRRRAGAAERRLDGSLRPTLPQMQLLKVIAERELHLDRREQEGIYLTACGHPWPQSAADTSKCIQALKAVKARRRAVARSEVDGPRSLPAGQAGEVGTPREA
jgi:hypothetical protein